MFRHEIVGIVTEVGGNVGKFKIGDHVGVGTYVDSCRDCENCDGGLEIHCSKGIVSTIGGTYEDGSTCKGGYSQFIVVHERCVTTNLCLKIHPIIQSHHLIFIRLLRSHSTTITQQLMVPIYQFASILDLLSSYMRCQCQIHSHCALSALHNNILNL